MTAAIAAGAWAPSAPLLDAGQKPRRWSSPGAETLRHPRLADIAHIPGKRGLPVVGVMPEVILDPLAFSERMTRRYGPVYRFHALGKWHLHLTGPEANEMLLFDPDSIFSAEGGWGPLVGPLFPGALLVRDGAEHRSGRRMLGEAFRQAELGGYQRIFAGDIDARVGAWAGREVDPYAEAKALTFRIAASTFLGLPLNGEAEEAVGHFASMMGGLLTIVSDPRFSLVRRRGFAAKVRLETLLGRLVREKRAVPGADFLSRMATIRDEEGRLLPVGEIVDSFIFLLSAAHDTMASALTSMTWFLASEREWAGRLRDELDEAGVVEPLDAAAAKLPLMEMFYKETLRLNGPAPIIWRRASRPFSIHGYDIPGGMMTGANLMMSHRRADVWPDPLRFDPLRFTPEAEKGRSRFAFAPFGAGVHKCLGMHFAQQQAKIFAAYLLLKLRLETVGNSPPTWYHWPNCRPRRAIRISARPIYRDR